MQIDGKAHKHTHKKRERSEMNVKRPTFRYGRAEPLLQHWSDVDTATVMILINEKWNFNDIFFAYK